jgi:NAD(P)-dependent dehydrogenase (short-subunit alcohol dehydrogenase family)
MNFSFKNKVALITGAGSGIGLATAIAFAEAGASVAFADLNENAVQAAVKKLTDSGYKAIALRCDVTNEAQVAGMVEKVVDAFGRLDLAYNNAGMHVTVAETADASGEEFDRAIAVNLKGIWNCMKYELQQMRKQGNGAIVNCSSQSGLVGTANLGAYTAAKHGVVGLTKSAALEYAPKGIRINAICPGTTNTPMVSKAVADAPEHMEAIVKNIPLGRLGRSEEVASTVLWLCSEGAGFMIGQAVTPDGGYTIQ